MVNPLQDIVELLPLLLLATQVVVGHHGHTTIVYACAAIVVVALYSNQPAQPHQPAPHPQAPHHATTKVRTESVILIVTK